MTNFGEVLCKNGNLIFEQNSINFTAEIKLYSTKILLGDRVGQTSGTTPLALHQNLLRLEGNCAYVARGIDAPV